MAVFFGCQCAAHGGKQHEHGADQLLGEGDGEMEDIRFFSIEEIDMSFISPPIRTAIQKYIDVYGGNK